MSPLAPKLKCPVTPPRSKKFREHLPSAVVARPFMLVRSIAPTPTKLVPKIHGPQECNTVRFVAMRDNICPDGAPGSITWSSRKGTGHATAKGGAITADLSRIICDMWPLWQRSIRRRSMHSWQTCTYRSEWLKAIGGKASSP